MKVINLNSEYVLSDGHLAFAERLARALSSRLGPDDRVGQLLDDIPIFLVDDDSMTENVKGAKGTDLLGFYKSASPILNSKIPVIGLCPERIRSSAAPDGGTPTDNQITWLVGKVLIHELAHALMDEPTELKSKMPDFYGFMEESMANVITLEAFEWLDWSSGHRRARPQILSGDGPSPLQYVREFIAKQPPEYRLALDLHDNNVGWWCIWESFKRKHSDCTNLPSTKICEFMSVVEASNINTVRLKTCVEGLLVSGAKS
jgi:hypothetical protein